jgi:branched-chain amino acid aminotransferase
MGLTVQERPVAIDEWKTGVASGAIKEVFACGTAAVVTPVGRLVWRDGEVGSNETGEFTSRLRKNLIDIQYGRAADTHAWMHQLV